jgi:hypothetical protein
MAVGAQQSSLVIQVLASNVLRWDIGQGLEYPFSPSSGSDLFFFFFFFLDTESAPIIQARELTFPSFDPILESYFFFH